jgi:hypothetical protein
MRKSFKIREAKAILDDVLEDNAPLHFGDSETYVDYVISTMVHLIHGSSSKEDEVLYFFEFKARFGPKIIGHYAVS